MLVLKTNELTKSYKNSKALCGLTMTVPQGAIYGLVGKNGAGKTTLIRLICGLQEPTSGEFWLYDTNYKSKKIGKVRKRIGAVVESPAIYSAMTARENLIEQYRILGIPSNDGIDELLSLVGLKDAGKKKVKNFSLGMRQRLAIAIALSGDPDFIILDEPTNGLDPQGIIEMRELILRLNQERGITFLISSHILDELSRIATHYGFVDGGKIVKEITARELEADIRKSVLAEVSDTKALARALDLMAIEYKIIDENCALIYEKFCISELVERLLEEGAILQWLKEKDESLEGYFINLVGGEKV